MRWIVERTFSWMAQHHQHSKDYQRNTDVSAALIYITMIGPMSCGLAKKLLADNFAD